MKRIKKHHLVTAMTSAICMAAVIWLFYSDARQVLDQRVIRPIEFRSRDYLDQNPKIDPSLKIFAFDDKTLAKLARPALTTEEWVKIFTALDRKKVSAVIVDKIFTTPPEDQYAIDQLKTLSNIKAPIVAGAFISPYPIKLRTEVPATRPEFSIPYQDSQHDTPHISDRQRSYLYGPDSIFQSAFSRIGHINYPGNFSVFPLFLLEKDRYIPHFAFYARQLAFKDGNIISGDIPVPLEESGSILVNFAPVSGFYKQTKGITSLLRPAMAGRDIASVAEGDTVLIIPGMFTGSTDFKISPFGTIPGGIIQAAVINSVLTGQWISYSRLDPLWIIISGLLGSLLGLTSSVRKFWFILLMAIVSLTALALAAFAYLSFVTPWFYCVGCFIMVAMVLFAKNSHYLEMQALEHQITQIKTEYLEKEMAMASKMALAFLPDEMPHWQEIEIGSFHKTFTDASGDWYAYAESTKGDLLHFVLCDIAGHGVQAALVVSSCKTVMSMVKKERIILDQDDFLILFKDLLNHILYLHGKGQHVTTFLGFTFVPSQNKVSILAAGHPPPYFMPGNEPGVRPKAIRSKSNLLGTAGIHEASLTSQTFEPGDQIVAFTDGVPSRSLVRILKKTRISEDTSLDDRVKEVIDEIWQMEMTKSGSTPDDDQSLLVFLKKG